MTAETKVCFECKETKPAAEFYPHPQHRDGLSTRCRVCFLAEMHRRWRAKHPEPEPWVMPTEKVCTRCKQLKPLDQFVRIKNPAKAGRDGHSPDCKPCRSGQSNKWNKTNRKRHSTTSLAHYYRLSGERLEDKKDGELFRRYGMSKGAYASLLAKQDGKCAICGTADPGGRGRFKRFPVDHCHETLIVRGLLCTNCNRGLGNFKHSPKTLISAANYLISHESSSV